MDCTKGNWQESDAAISWKDRKTSHSGSLGFHNHHDVSGSLKTGTSLLRTNRFSGNQSSKMW